MHGGLELARPRRRKKRIWIAAAVLLVVGLVVSAPYGAALLPAGLSRCLGAVANWVRPHYTEELAALQQQNARLHSRLALAEEAQAENEALRSLLGCARTEGHWQPARVTARRSEGATLACTAAVGAAVLDPQGRYAGQVVENREDGTCEFAFAGTENAPCAGLSGSAAGLLERKNGWFLAGLPADCGLTAGSVVTTPGGEWLGELAAAPQPDSDGLTARAPLTDTADLNSTVFFVKIE